MKFILPLFLIFSWNTQLAGQRFDIHFVYDGRLRECIIVKPTTAPPVGGYPVVFMLHGTSGDGEKFYNISGWKELGEQENFITVFPSSLSWCFVEDGVEKHNTRWVNGSVIENPCSGPPQNYVDDIKFLKKLVSLIDDTLKINSKKVFASGFSNGCTMIHKMAMDAGDVFAAVAGSSGMLTESDSIIPPVHRIPLWVMVGTLDDRFIVAPFTELPYGRDTILGYLQNPIRRILACQGLTTNFSYKESPNNHSYIFNESQSGGLSTSPYIFTLNKGQTHEFPNGSNFPVDAPRLFWEFFQQSSLVAAENASKNENNFTIYPNPSVDVMQVHMDRVNSNSHFQLRVLNSFGQTVYKEDQIKEREFMLEKSKIGSGLFLLQIQQEHRIMNKKILFN